MRSRDKKVVLEAIDAAVKADKLNEFIIDLIEWHREHSELTPRSICDDILENIGVKSRIKIVCKECNGTGLLDKDYQIFKCPYCSSKSHSK